MESGQGLANRMPLPQVTWRSRWLQRHTSTRLTWGGDTHTLSQHVAASQYHNVRGTPYAQTVCQHHIQSILHRVTAVQQANAGNVKGLTEEIM